MASLAALQSRVASLEALVEERDARIAALEQAVQTLTVGGAEAEPEWSAKKVREAFIEFFVEQHGHTFWKSSPCVPHDDPTLLFCNAGMNQFKPLFLGTCEPTLPMYKLKGGRAVNSQKCIRAGGKHNDLDDVGKDVYHHTYFEMLGNWSFGDYFKEEACKMAWECLTVKYGLDPERLYVTYFGGDEVKAPGVPSDEECKQIWLSLGLPESRILPFDAGDNFWEMGDVGPCGPCTEIHYDRIGGRDAAHLVNIEPGDPDVIEIWNNVFMQFNRSPTGLVPLDEPSIDTGMGFERLTSIMQNKRSNYDTDVFTPLFAAIQEVTGAEPYTGLVGEEDTTTKDMAYRVVADHIRTLTYSISDGARPDNNGRGYVLRRILRRAVYFGSQFLGAKPGFFNKLVPSVVATYGDFFEEIKANEQVVINVLKEEEAQFNKTIDKGLKVFKKKAAELKKAGSTVVPGADCFFLSGSLGFPLDLTEIMAEQIGMTVDKEGYEAELKKEADKNTGKGGEGQKDMLFQSKETVWLGNENIAVTNQAGKYTTGAQPEATVLAIFTGRGALPSEKGFQPSATGEDEVVGFILDSTPFYPEAGGQVPDVGTLTSADGSKAVSVSDVQVYAGYVLHIGTINDGSVAVGDVLTCAVDYDRREKIAPNHTMTHVLNYALRKVLLGGPNDDEEKKGKISQKGSHVDENRLRFDFGWDKPVSTEQMAEVERLVNEQISSNLQVYDYQAPLAEAMEIYGLRAVFGENYPDPVRVVSVGISEEQLKANPKSEDWANYSVEFCGGTHVQALGVGEVFVITEETGTAAGVRRISGVTREKARECNADADKFATRLDGLEALEGPALAAELKVVKNELNSYTMGAVRKAELVARLDVTAAKVLAWQKEQTKAKAGAASATVKELAKSCGDAAKVVARIDFGVDGKTSSKLMKDFGKANKTSSLLIISAGDEGFGIYCNAAKAHMEGGLDALQWVQATVEAAGGGKSGGRPNNANGQVASLAGIDAAEAAAKAFVA